MTWPHLSTTFRRGESLALRSDLLGLPDDLAVPLDDGGAAHLVGIPLPNVSLPATSGRRVDVAALPGRIVIYCFPRIG